MKSNRLFSLLLSALVIVSLGMAAVPMTPASAGPAPSGQAQGTNGETLGYDPETGHLIFIGAPAGGAIASLAGDLSALSTEQQADSFVAAYGSAFGLSDPSQELVAQSSVDGDQVTRYQQTYQGIPVFGGNLVVSTTPQGGLVAMAGKVSTELNVNVTPAISAESAAGTALGLVAKLYELQPSQMTAGTPALWIYDERMFTESAFGPQLVWKVEVTVQGAPIREVVLVNAQYGKISQHYNEIDTAWVLNGQPGTRKPSEPQVSALAGGSPVWSIYDAENWELEDYELPGYVLVCDNTDPNCGTDVGALDARDYTLDTYDFYWNILGRDGIDELGMEIISTIHYGDPFSSGPANWFKNAYWDGFQMVYGDRVAVDDVVAHELTHGVTEYSSGLLYLYQSGAINESLSDVFGELIDLSNVDDYYVNDTTGRWLIGESIEGPAKAFRNMKNPPAFKNPDKMTSTLYYKGAGDNGGVHTNSGVNNKAAYLMTDGGVFNGYTVSGIGIEKVAKIYYKAQTGGYLFPGADYLNLYYALKGACSELYGVSNECEQVEKATKAVEMHIKPVTVTGPVVDACPAGTAESSTILSEDFEDVTGEWDFTGTGTDIDFSTYPFGYNSGPLATSSWSISEYPDSMGLGSALWGGGPAELNDYLGEVINWDIGWVFDDFDMEYAYEDATLTDPLILPAGKQIYLTFDHMYKFNSSGPTKNWDGGILEYSDNGGSTWKDAKPLFSAGTNYNGTVFNYTPDAAYQPLSAKQAFVANSLNGMLGMRYNLTSLAGQSDIKLRFRAGYDIITDWGWFIDNVDVHTCVANPAVPLLSTPADKALTTIYTPTLVWFASSPDLDHYQIQINTDPGFGVGTMFYDDSTGTTSNYITDPLDPNTTYYWRVRSLNSVGGTKGWSLVRSFRTAILPPELTSPLFTPPVPPAPAVPTELDNKRPTLVWGNVDGAVSYTVEAALLPDFKVKAINATVTDTANPTMSYTHTVDLLGDKTYHWRVIANVAKGGNGPSAYSAVWQFHTSNPPSVPVLVTPLTGALLTDYTPLLDWGNSTLPVPVPPALPTTFASYRVQVDDNNNFSSPEVDASVGTGVLATSQHEVDLLDSLAPNTPYYWRVNASNTDLDVSAWSLVRSFRTAILPPVLTSPLFTPPVPPAPAVPTELDNKRPTLVWGNVDGAVSYTVEAALLPDFKVKAINATVTDTANPTMSYTHTVDLLGDKTYHWRVIANVAKGGNGPSAYSAVWQFHTSNPPSVPVLVTPLTGALLTDYTPLLDWGNSTLPVPVPPALPTTFASYRVQVDDNNNFSSPEVDASVGTGVLATSQHEVDLLDSLAPNTPYYWRVNASNTDLDVSAWSLVRSFRTAILPPVLTSPLFTPPVPPAPAVPTELDNKRPTLVWGNVDGAVSYTVEAALLPDFKVKAINATVTDTANPTMSYTHTVDLLGDKTYHWRVIANVAKGGNGPSAYSAVWQFHTSNPPSVPVLVTPLAGALLTDYTPLLDWGNSTLPLPPAAPTTFASYRVQVDNNSDFGSPEVDELVGVGAPATSQYELLVPLAANATYYWRVNASNTDLDVSVWSLVRSFHTVIEAPVLTSPLFTPPVPPAPAVPTELDNKRPTLVWGNVDGAVSYTVEAALLPDFKVKAINATVTDTANPTMSYTHTVDLLGDKTYHWRVIANVAKGGNGPSAYSAVWQFHTSNPPSVPVLVTPLTGALLTDYTPLLDWGNSTLPVPVPPALPTTFASYRVQVDDNNNFSSPEVDASVGAGVLATSQHEVDLLDSLAPNTPYYWRVNALNTDLDVSAWSLVRSFRTAILPPVLTSPLFTPPVPPAPAVPTELDNKRPTLVWGNVDGAVSYTVEAALLPDFKVKAINATVTDTANPTMSYTHTVDLLGDKTYHWRVIANVAKGGNGPSAYSAVWQFHTSNPPSTPALVAPAANALVTSFTPTLDWANSTLPLPLGSTTFLRYNLQVDNNNDFGSPEIEKSTAIGDIADSKYDVLVADGLDPKVTYYWRVNAENTDNDVSAWSAVRTFRTPLDIPVLNEPVLGSTTTTYRPIFDWDDVPGAVSYTIQISTGNAFTTFVVNVTPTGAISDWAPVANLPMGTVYWRVRANSAAGGNGPSPWATSSFNVVAP